MKNAVSVHFFLLHKRKQTAESGILFFFRLILHKKICFYGESTQIKANSLQFRLSLRLKRVVAFTVRRKNSSDCTGAACTLTVKLCYFDNAACSSS